MGDVITLGLFRFLPFVALPLGDRRLLVKYLIAAVYIFCGVSCFPGRPVFPVFLVHLGIIGLVVFQHAVDDPQDFVHAQSDGCHLFHSLFRMFFIDFSDMGIGRQGNHGDHKEDLPGFLASLFAHADAAGSIAAGFECGMKPEVGCQLLDGREPFYGLDFEH